MFCTKCGGQLAQDGSCPRCAQVAQQAQDQPQFQQYQNPASGYTPAPAPKAGLNFQKILDDKFKLMTIVGIIGTIAVLALPILSIAGMLNITLFVLFSSVFSMIPNVGGLGMVGIILLLSLLAGAFSIYGAYKKNNQFILYGSAGAAGMLLIFFIILSSAISNVGGAMEEVMEQMGPMAASPSVFNFLGFGFWIAAIAFIANIILSIKNNK